MTSELHDALHTAMDNDEFESAMSSLVDGFVSYREQLPHIEGACSRTLLSASTDFEVVAMCWAPGSHTAIHDHANSHCWVVLIDGNLEVENFERLDDGAQDLVELRATGSFALRPGDFDSRSGPREFHRVENNTPNVAYSLQLYAPPLVSFSAIADETTGRSINVPAKHDAVLHLTNV